MATNTGLYCEVNLPQRDTVLDGPRTLPQNYTDQNGNSQKNVNNTDVWNDQGTDGRNSLYDIGLYPYVENDTGAPNQYYDRSLSDFSVNADNVSRDAIYTQWDIELVKADKNVELEEQITIYSTNDQAVNEKVLRYIRDDVQWVADKQAELARITDWQQAADFDTTKPSILPLSNTYKGASYVDQGLDLTGKNQAAVAAGQSEIWPQAEINTWVTANRTAAEDSSGSTPVQDPSYRFRQGVAKVSERFNRIIIWREARDDPNPALRTTYKMQMRNRQDSRDLFIFSYTNGTYLTWRKFEDQGNGVWALEATPAEWQYVPGDMAFIFSYGTNPAVEADYFTDRVEFPAGVTEKNILVAWDPQ